MSAEHGPSPEQMGLSSEEINTGKPVDAKPGRFERFKKAAKKVARTGVIAGAAFLPIAEKPAQAQVVNPSSYGPMSHKEYPKKEKHETPKDQERNIEKWLEAIAFKDFKVTVIPPRGRELVEKHAFTINFGDDEKHAVLFKFDAGQHLTEQLFFEKFKVALDGRAFGDMSEEDKQALLARIEKELTKAPVAAADSENQAQRGNKSEAKEKSGQSLKKSVEMANHELKKLGMDKRYEARAVDEQPAGHQRIAIYVKGNNNIRGIYFDSHGKFFTERQLQREVDSIFEDFQRPEAPEKK